MTKRRDAQMIIGIDNGLDGGLCAISTHDGSIIDMIPMPTFKNGTKREVDTKAINSWILNLSTPFAIAIEEPLRHARSSQAMRSMSISFGKIVGMAESKNYRLARIDVHEWQSKILGKIPKGHTKIAALKKANKLAPEEKWLATARSYVPHDGMVDAFLIGTFYLTTMH